MSEPGVDQAGTDTTSAGTSSQHLSGMHTKLTIDDLDDQIFQAGEAWEALAALIDAGDGPGVLHCVQHLPLASTAATIMNLGQPRLGPLWTILVGQDIEFAADLLEHFADWQGASILSQLPSDIAAKLVMRMDSDDQVDVLAKTGRDVAERILAALAPSDAANVRERLHYDEDTAGRVMVTEIITFPAELVVDDVIRHVRREHQHYRQHELRYIFLYRNDLRLFGVVPLTSLLIAEEDAPLKDLIIDDFPVVDVHAPLDILEDSFDRHDHFSLPVIDGRGRLVGAVQRASVFEALRERAEERLLEAAGIFGGEELRTMPLGNRIFRRLSFLLPSVVLSYAAVSVISFFEPVIAEVTALAIFLPMVANLSGAAGNQSVAVSIRELSLGLVSSRDLVAVWMKEFFVGVVNGILLGALLGGIVHWWRGDIGLAAVIAASYAAACALAVLLGGGLPLLLRRLGVDPAMLASPILTTLTDMSAFFLVLSLAKYFLLTV